LAKASGNVIRPQTTIWRSTFGIEPLLKWQADWVSLPGQHYGQLTVAPKTGTW